MTTTTKKIPIPVALKDFAKKNGFFVNTDSIVSNGSLIKFYHVNKNYNEQFNILPSSRFFIRTLPEGGLFSLEAKSTDIPKMKGKTIKAKSMKELTTKLGKFL